MSWQTVALILGLALNFTIIFIAMSEGGQWYLGTRHSAAQRARGTHFDVPEALPEDEITRRL